MQDSDIEGLIDSYGNYSAKTAFSYTSPSALHLLLGLVDRGANGGLAHADVCVLENWEKSISHWY